MRSVRKPWWQQATALVTVTTGGVITGFNFVPGAAATMTTPTSVPLHLLALEQAGQPGAVMNARAVGGDSTDTGTSDGLLRSAIVNVAKYYLQIAATRTPAQMEALIWDNTSLNGSDQGPSCAAFASLTLELAAQAVGQQSWVTGGTTYPIPLPAWADVRVDTNPGSPAVISVMADAERHDRWHPVSDGYQPQPGDWVLFNHHVEVVTRYAGGTLDTIGADSNPGLTVNAHSYGGSLMADGVVGFVDNGHLAPAGSKASADAAAPAASSDHDSSGAPKSTPAAAPAAPAAPAGSTGHDGPPTADKPTAGGASDAVTAAGVAAIPGVVSGAGPEQDAAAVPGVASSPGSGSAAGTSGTEGTAAIPGAAVAGRASTGATADSKPAATGHHAGTAAATSGMADVPGVVQPAGAGSGGGSSSSATRSGSQALDDRGVAAAIPGGAPATGAGSVATGSGKAGSGKAGAGAAEVPGASPVVVAPATHPVTTPAAHPSSAAAHPSASASSAPEQYKQHTPASQATPGTRVQQAFISLIAPGAVAAQARWGVPAAVTIAQAIEESSWGNSSLASEYHNLFGIKGSGPAGSVGLPTDEFYNGHWVSITAQFRVYHNVAESIADHAELLATSGYYQRAMADRAIPDAFANDLTGVYATDPDYGANLIAIMKLYNLYRFDAPAQPAQSAPAHSPQATTTPTAAASPSASAPAPTPSASQPATAQPLSAPSAQSTAPATTPSATAAPSSAQPSAAASAHGSAGDGAGAGQAMGAQAAVPGLGAPAVAPTSAAAAPAAHQATAHQSPVHGQTAQHPTAQQQTAQIPGMQAPALGGAVSSVAAAQSVATPQAVADPQAAPTPQTAPTPKATATDQTAAGPAHGGAVIPGVAAAPGSAAPAGTTSANFQRQPGAARRAVRYQPQFTTAVTTAYFASAKGPLGHGEHLYRDVAGQTGIRWELLAACDWMQCKANPRLSPVHGEKIGALNSDGTSYATKSAALGQCADDLIELAAAVYGIDLTARRVLSVRALADAFAAFRWGALLLRHGVSAMEFPYSVAGLTAQHQKMHWPVINDPAAPDRPGARFREPFGAVPVVLSLDYPATVLTDRKRRQPCSGSSPGSAADAGLRPIPSPLRTASR